MEEFMTTEGAARTLVYPPPPPRSHPPGGHAGEVKVRLKILPNMIKIEEIVRWKIKTKYLSTVEQWNKNPIIRGKNCTAEPKSKISSHTLF